MADKKTVPYYCPLCIDEKGCGYHGILVFPGQDIPTCSHHTSETNAPDLPKLVPVSSRGRDAHSVRADLDLLLSGMFK